ncbi:DUF4347 domain-containing protein, partial [Planktothrix tepida]|uniref:DUF4347 domain-containing protein n=1 Tax=Planktothrix tepida TaxID=1678309 RepID=UPI0011154885
MTQPSCLSPVKFPVSNPSTTLVFIDSQVEDYQSLIPGVKAGVEIVVLDSTKDGIQQITTILCQRPQRPTVHLVAHGSPGCLNLGNSQLNLETLEKYKTQLKGWSIRSLCLYGCEVGRGDKGEEFIEKLHKLTQAPIAASANFIGKGNWQLEKTTHPVSVEVAFQPEVIANYTGVLAAGDLDTSFGGGDGIVTTPVGTVDAYGWSVAVQGDGKILVAGYSYNSTNSDITLVRYNGDGTPDSLFGGGNGIVTTPVGAAGDEGWSVAVQGDGKILVAGYSYGFNNNNTDFALVRYNANGTLDTSFDTDGIVTTAVGSSYDLGRSVAVQADGKILVAGNSFNDSNNNDFALVRYNTNGTLDTSFDADGIVTTDLSSSYDEGWSVAVQADGKILVAGDSFNDSNNNDFALVRYNTNGTLDTSFDTDGIVTADLSSLDGSGYSVAVQADGKILVAGQSYNSSNSTNDDFALVRYNGDGTPDSLFGGGDGIVTTDFGTSYDDVGRSVGVQGDGKILVAGYSYNNGIDSDIALVRYNADGTPDSLFGGGDGIVTTAVGTSYDLGRSVAVQADGKILVAGFSNNGSNNWDIALVRYDGTLFGTSGSDTLVGTPNADDINSLAGNDTLDGLGSNDTLRGGDGNDLLIGGVGSDSLVGETGNDTYDVDNAGDIVTELAGEGTDLVQSSVSYTLPANVENLTLTGSAAINGTGNNLNNIITGNTANNILDGSSGADLLQGQGGSDTYNVDNAGDIVTELAGQGTDLVQSSISYTLPTEVENLTLTGTAAINGTGNSLNNIIIGNSANNILDGSSGADQLQGQLGNDTYNVDNAGDIVTELASQGTDLVQSSISYTLATEVENLTLTGTAAINGTGNSLNNIITGNIANNILAGKAGNDTYIVDNAGDIVTELAGEGTDLVQSSVTYTLPTEVENLILTGTATIDGTGNSLDNSITGNTANNILDGSSGADQLQGQTGDDIYNVDNTGDIVTELAGQGTDIVQSSVSYTLPTEVENLTLIGTAAINGTGNSLNNIITGNIANNLLDGSSGADQLQGQAGNDTYNVDNAGDIVTELAGQGTDIVQSSISYTLPTEVENLTLTGTATIDGTGNSLNNIITGNIANNILAGKAGNDTYNIDNPGDIVTELAGEGIDLVQSSISYTLPTEVENLTLTG